MGDEGANPLLAALAAACDFAIQAALPAPMTRRLAIVVEEIVSNVLRHAGPAHDTSLTLRLDRRDDGVFVTLEDDTAPFDPRLVPLPDRPNPERGGGVGLALVKAWSDIVAYDRLDDRNRLVLWLHPCSDDAIDPASALPRARGVMFVAEAGAPLDRCAAPVHYPALSGGVMSEESPSLCRLLIATMLGERTAAVLDTIDLDVALAHRAGAGRISRVHFAAALNAVLFDDLLARAPTGARFVADQRARGERIRLDHGALRTIRFPAGTTGALPPGQDAFTRILEPLGYRLAGTYPLPRLKMTGRAWAQQDMPEALPQFFISELHVERFDPSFATVAAAVFGASRDPLTSAVARVLAQFASAGEVSFADAKAALPVIAGAFGRQHPLPTVADYRLLLDHSAEAAWIATEGNAFNHATSRVADVGAEAERQRRRGLPIKDAVEVSQTGRVRQTAFRADPVLRQLREPGGTGEQAVPGSFYEIIARDLDPATGTLDLSFDSGNATGIFAMTRA